VEQQKAGEQDAQFDTSWVRPCASMTTSCSPSDEDDIAAMLLAMQDGSDSGSTATATSVRVRDDKRQITTLMSCFRGPVIGWPLCASHTRAVPSSLALIALVSRDFERVQLRHAFPQDFAVRGRHPDVAETDLRFPSEEADRAT
jgi:hypothetical protein